MVKIAKIVNRYGKTYMVPLFRAKEMIRNEEIEDYDIIEVEKTKNFEKPQTQKDFERGLNGPKSIAEQENEALREQIALLTQKAKLESNIKAPVTAKAEPKVENQLLDALKEKADILEIKYNPNIWEVKLEEKINAFENKSSEEIKIPEIKKPTLK